MDIFEKQQTIDAIKVIIMARWFYASVIFLQGIAVKFILPGLPLASTPILSIILVSAFFFNLGYWLYIRRPAERMSKYGLQTVKAMQVIMDEIWITAILFFSGTVGKMAVMAYLIPIMNGASFYKKKGVILSTLFCQFLFTLLVLFQISGIMKSDVPIKEVFSYPFDLENKQWASGVLLGFYAYSLGGAIFGGYLAGLFRRRETRLQTQKDELNEKTELLTSQTQELTQAKGELQSALTRSDITRKAADRARDESDKVNLELKKKIDELERFYKITVGREVKMAEMKQKIKGLEEKIKKTTE